MYSEKTEIVDVVAVDNGYSLSKKAGDLYEAARNGDVIRRHNISDSPAVVNFAYVGLSEVKKDSSGFKFTFASGDEFTASDADAYPSASSISDAIAGGGSDSPALINLYDPDSEDTETYYPDGAYDSDEGVFVLDVSAAYERLKRGQNVWIRWYFDEVLCTELVYVYYENDDALLMETVDASFKFSNYTGESESDGE